ncbi:hypothetical protein EEJ42_41325 [Streptomyces botrytidirepellens]|uniref:Uncharacterized protein n=1 Tax=Streptomyces botrytidirepellens TaxID=2486417 RepID=A0A3M8T581_9ACTN|nr:hypothetical protein EEJ42_41325 [Streptomyces botrytidirepellens]
MSGERGVRHRRTDGGRICLACGNIVSHHRVGAVVGCSGRRPSAVRPVRVGPIRTVVGSWNELSRVAGLACGRTGRGSSPIFLTALRSD